MSGVKPAIDANAITAGLQTRAMGRELHVVDRVRSTNDLAKALAEDGASHGTTVLAVEQTGGRGRRGRTWASPPGGLWLSVILRPQYPVTEWPRVGFAASLAAAIAAEMVTALPVRLKWPNDLMLDGRKLGGVLVEAGTAYAVVGIGMNVNVKRAALPQAVQARATSLEERLGRSVNLVALTQEVLGAFERLYELVEDNPHALIEMWGSKSDTLGRMVEVVGASESFEGVAERVDEQGALIVRTDAGLRRVLASDVSVREPPPVPE